MPLSNVVTWLRLAVALLFLAFNLLPLYGIRAWGWDAFQLLILYWMETLVLFAVTLTRLGFVPPALLGTMTVNGKVRKATRRMTLLFFAVHAGMFIFAHLFFLLILFSSGSHISFNAGVWAMLALAVLAGAIEVLTGQFRPAFMGGARPRPASAGAASSGGGMTIEANGETYTSSDSDVVGSIVAGLYIRIFIMQAAVIFGAWAAKSYGSLAPLVIVVALKALIDFLQRLHGALARPSAAAASPAAGG